jgi:hypothetical protein
MDYNQSNAGYTTLRAIAPEEGYDAWAAAYTSSIGSAGDDHDGDSFNNFYEYALNGDPVDPQNNGVAPELVSADGGLDYIYLRRNNDPNLVYIVEARTNLLSGVWTAAGGSVSTNSTEGDFDEVIHTLPMDDSQSYVRLKISSQ